MGFLIDFFKVKGPSDFFSGLTDIHSHILPGVDDGVRDMAGFSRAMREFSSLGFDACVLTPHVMTDFEHNCRASLTEVFSTLPPRSSSPRLRLGAEYMVDGDFLSHREEGWLTLDEKGQYLLVESSYVDCHPDFEGMLYEACLSGVTPVIAHPERYAFADDELYEEWKDKGYLFQMNFMSLSGRYGPMPAAKAASLLKRGMYDFAGTDLHHPTSISTTLERVKLRSSQWDAIHSLFENNRNIF